ncbi:MAG: YqaJ viral recombinase family protein [Oscillospiraceae bacterium]|nr:YqaJ viral recombinase family protein [Oscillospiraceae bacterium]
MITKIKTESREEWLTLRRQSIGGSDAGTICGYNPYSSKYALWAEKTGAVVPEDISEKEAVRLGNDLEDYAAKRFTEKTGIKVRKVNFTFRNDKYPFAHANIDRDVVGEDAGLEIKTTSNYEYIKLCESGDFPAQWYAQMIHYMMVTEKKKWYLAVLCFGRGFYIFEIERTAEIEKEIEALAGIEKGFWQEVLSRTPPDIDGSKATTEAIGSIFGKGNCETEIDLSGAAEHLYKYKAISGQIKQLENLLEEEKNRIKVFMGEATKGSFGDFGISWKEQKKSTFDSKRFALEHPEIDMSIYYRESTSRVFRFNERKA